MSEPEKKGSAWPWFLVPVAAISLFFVLRQCRQNLPPAEHAPTGAMVEPAPDGRRPALRGIGGIGAGTRTGAAIDLR